MKPRACLAIDCAGLSSFDAIAISLFVRCVRDADACGASLRLFNLGPGALAIAEMARLHLIVSICNSEDEAIRSFLVENEPVCISEPSAPSGSLNLGAKAAAV